MAIQVKNNSFYRRVPISTSGAVKLLSQFKDLPTAEASTLTLAGAAGANRIVFSGSTPPDPPFGGGKLNGGYLTLTPQSTDLTKTGKLPQVALYKAKDDTRVLEGGMYLGTSGSGGDSLMVFSTTFDENIPNLEENFDGASKSLGDVPTVGTSAGGRNIFSDEFLFPEDAAEKVHAGGDYSMFHVGEDPEETGGDFMRRYFGRVPGSEVGEVNRGAFQNRVIFVRPRNRKKPHGFWTMKYDNRTGLNKYTVFAPIWKYNDIKGSIQFVKRTPATDGEPPELTKNNTIFDHIGKSPTNETLSTMDPDNSTPWSQTFLQLQSEVQSEGGTALEMSHIWSWTSAAPNSNIVYGDAYKVNPQFTVLGGPVIPYPIALDNTLAFGSVMNSEGCVDKRPIETATLTGDYDYDPRSTDILANNATFASATKFFYISYWDDDTNLIGGFSSGSAWSVERAYLFDRDGITRSTTNINLGAISEDASGRIADTGGGSNAVAPFVSMKVNIAKMDGTIFASGAASSTNAILGKKYISATASGSDAGGADQYITGTTNPMRTFLRSFVITLGNYPALDGEPMDGYVLRGLEDAYLSGDKSLATKKNIGGIAFQRFIDTSEDHENQYIVASPLKTRKSMFPWDDDDTNQLYELIGSSGGRGTYTEAGVTVTASGSILMDGGLLDPRVHAGSRSVTANRDHIETNYEPCMKLAMNEFFDIKFVFSLQGKEIGTDTNTTPADNDNVSSVCRAYIQQGEVEESASGNPIIPSLPVYFPCSGMYDTDGNTGGSITESKRIIRPWGMYHNADDESGYPARADTTTAVNMWPKYIYFWCQNYRYIDKTATGSTDRNSDGFWGKGSATQTIMYDTATEKAGERGVTVYIDSFALHNFNSITENNSASAGILSRPITIRESAITGYMGVDYNTTTSGTRIDTVSTGNDVAGSYQNQNADGFGCGGFPQFPDARGIELPKRFMPAYVSIGFEGGTDDLYATGNTIGGNDYTGWLLWSGFAYDNFQKLSRQDLHTTNIWYSSQYNLQLTPSTQNSQYLQYRGKDLFSDYSRGTGTSESRSASGKMPAYVMKGNIPTGTTSVAPLSLLQYTGSDNTVLSTDGFCSKGTMRINVHNGAQTTLASTPSAGLSQDLVLTDASDFPSAGTLVLTSSDGDYQEGTYTSISSNTLEGVSLSATYANYMQDVTAEARFSGQVINAALPTENMAYNWAKRENPLTSAKIIGAPKYDQSDALASYNGGVLMVDDPQIFDEGTIGDTEYVAYQSDAGATSRAYNITGATGEFFDTASAIQGLKQLRRRDGDIIFFDVKLDHITADFNVGNSWYISPRKYWINMAFYPGDGTLYADGEIDSFANQSGLPFVGTGYKGHSGVFTNYVMDAQARNSSKFYDTIGLLSGTAAQVAANTGSTYNEWTYNWNSTEAANALVGTSSKAGVYGKGWILDKAEKTETNLDLTKDYGYGAYNADDGTGGEVDVQTVYSGEQTPFDLSEIIQKNNSGPDASFVTTINLFTPTADQKAVLYGNDYSTATDAPDFHLIKPHYLFQYYDELPQISGMSVGPAFDVLDRETNLYELQKENLSGIKFNWTESGDDVWYRMLFVNDAPISNKYCNAELWFPLNETGNSGSSPAYTFYKPIDGFSSGSLTTGAHCRADPIGLQGYAFRATKYATGGDGFLQFPHASGAAMTSSTDYLFLLHTTPMLTSASGGSLYSKGTASSDGFEVSINSAGKVVVQQRGTSLTGTTQLDRSNDVNYQIAVKYQQTGVKKFSLYVNGKEEAYDITAPSAVSSTAVTYIGSGSVGAYEGIIEEIVYYEIDKTKNDVRFVEDSETYIYNNPYLLDKTGTGAADTTYSHYGRIALFDYHNVRGRGRTQVAMSNTTAWRATAL